MKIIIHPKNKSLSFKVKEKALKVYNWPSQTQIVAILNRYQSNVEIIVLSAFENSLAHYCTGIDSYSD